MYNQPYYPQQFNQQYAPQQIPKRTEIIHVNGEPGAQAFQMMPNSQALLLDDTAPLVWLAQTDGAGYKTVTPYTIAPYKAKDPIDMKSLEERIERLEGILNAKSNVADVKQVEPDNGTDSATA